MHVNDIIHLCNYESVPEHSFEVWTIQARPIYPVTGYWCLTSLNTAEMISNWCTFTQ